MIRRSCAVGLLVVLIVGCSHSGNSTQANQTSQAQGAAPTSARGPCDLLTATEVAAVTHHPVGEVKQIDATHCTYGPKGGGMNTIIVEFNATDADAQFAGGQAANKLMGSSEKPAPKVGDASYSIAMGNVFYARKGKAYVGIDLRAAAVPVAKVGPQLAAKAIAKM